VLKSFSKYPFALIALLTVFTSTWYAKTTWSNPVVSPSADDRINVAAAANGGVAVASTTLDDQNFPASAVIDGDRKGLSWGAGGGWADNTPGAFPDTVDVEFADVYAIDEIDVVTVQDTWWNPVEPTDTMTFFNNGITGFELQYFDGRNWLPIPGGSVTGNGKVLRKFTFSPVVAEKVRIQINAGRSTYSMLVELEAYGVPAEAPSPSPTPTPSPLPTPSGDIDAAFAERDIFFDVNNNIGFGTAEPIFNDDGTTGAFVGKWFAIDSKLPGSAAYLGLGGNTNVNDRVGALNFYNLAMGGADHRTAAIFSFNGSKLGTGTLEFFTSPNFIGPVRRMQIAPTGEIGINHAAAAGTMLQVMGRTADASTNALGVLNASDHPLLTVRNDGQVSVGQPGQGIVLKSPNGQVCRKLTIDDAGNLVLKVMATCP